MELKALRKIWDAGVHNAFTDLMRWEDRWLCVFREGEDHESPDGAVRVIASADGRQWESVSLIRLGAKEFNDLKPEVAAGGSYMDLRDPKICVAPDGRLMLNAGLDYNDSDDLHSLVWYSDDGANWGQPVLVGEHQYWLWRMSWHKGRVYAVGRKKHERIPRFYGSSDGHCFEALVKDEEFFPHVPGPSEATIRFQADDTGWCLLRLNEGVKTTPGYIGRARPPYTQWEWKNLGVEIGGPNMIELPDGKFVAAVRLYAEENRTSVCWLDPEAGEITEALALPSGGDTSYPGMVLHDGVLWVSYYSGHEGKVCIYLAQVELEELEPGFPS